MRKTQKEFLNLYATIYKIGRHGKRSGDHFDVSIGPIRQEHRLWLAFRISATITFSLSVTFRSRPSTIIAAGAARRPCSAAQACRTLWLFLLDYNQAVPLPMATEQPEANRQQKGFQCGILADGR
jgi:hypothetical protein